jgi:hypothetical protein
MSCEPQFPFWETGVGGAGTSLLVPEVVALAAWERDTCVGESNGSSGGLACPPVTSWAWNGIFPRGRGRGGDFPMDTQPYIQEG